MVFSGIFSPQKNRFLKKLYKILVLSESPYKQYSTFLVKSILKMVKIYGILAL